MPFRIPLAASFLTLALALTLSADDWPTFRGPNRDGVSKETGLLQTWPKDGPPRVWTAKNLGTGFGTPTVAAGKIFGMGTRGGKDGVWALTEADGKELWFTPFDDPRGRGPNTGPSSSPTYDDGKVFAVSSGGKLVCLDAGNGKSAWQRDYLADFGGKVPGWGYTESVLVDGDKLVCAPGGGKATVVALDKKTGKDVWKCEVPGGGGGGGGYSSVLKATLAGAPMYVVLLGASGGVAGVSPDGKVLWQYTGRPAAGGTAQIPIPVVSGNHVWVSTSYGGGSALLEIVAAGKDKFTVKEVKKHAKPDLNNHHGGMVKVGDYVYFGHEQNQGNPVCVDLKTGEPKWGPVRPPAGGKAGSAAVLYADNRLYFRYQSTHDVYLVEPSPEGLKVVSSFKEPEPSGKESWAHPVVANGKLYLRDQDKLHCFNVRADKN